MNNKLELTWFKKEIRLNVEPRLLIENSKLTNTEFDENTENILVHGDNLLGLKALETKYHGLIKCIYIDPPYNTGRAFDHYDDNVEHSIWLSLMLDRLYIFRNLLKEDGSIWISIDDDERDYLKIICDEVFGRNNFVASVIWQKKGSRSNDAKWFSDNHDYILVYAKNKNRWRPNKLSRGKGIPQGYSNPDNDPRGPWTSTILSAKSGSDSLLYEIVTPSGRKVIPPSGRFWSCSRQTYEKWLSENRIWFGPKGDNSPRKKTFLSDVQDGLVPLTVWLRDEVGDNQEAKHEIKALNLAKIPFDTPKPERLIERIIEIATKENDFVLDSFLGSGTTCAVAHKMNRRWIGIEMGEDAYVYCKPRMDLIINGQENGGITKKVGWKKGGGYRFYEIAASLLNEDEFGQLVINKEYNPEMLASAVALHEGYNYSPIINCFWKQSYNCNNSFLFVTTNHVSKNIIDSILLDMKSDEYLLICCKSYDSNALIGIKNISIKKIPQSLLKKCEYGKDDYKLNIICPPVYEEDEDDEW